MSDRLNHLGQALDCSHGMLDCARDQRWDELPELEARRAALLREYAVAAAAMPHGGADEAAAEADLLARLIEANDDVMRLGERHRCALADSISSNQQQRRAASAYSATPAR